MSVARTYVLVMLISGALAGLAGANIVLGTAHTLSTDTVGTIGFDGITVALLGRGKPFGSVLAGLLFGALQAGAVQMQTEANISTYIATVLQALIVLFVAAPALVKAIFRLRAQRAGSLGQTLAKGWNG
jgi:simple sugar transport system permease protein